MCTITLLFDTFIEHLKIYSIKARQRNFFGIISEGELVARKPTYDTDPLRRLRTDEKQTEQLHSYLLLDVVSSALATTHAEADRLADEYGADVDVTRLYLFGLLCESMDAALHVEAGEVRANGKPLVAIADALGWVGTGNVKRAIPELEEIAAAKIRARETYEPQYVYVKNVRFEIRPED